MMEIKDHLGYTKWWQGHPLPGIVGRLYSIVADGDEAEALWALLRERERPKSIATDWNTQGESHAG